MAVVALIGGESTDIHRLAQQFTRMHKHLRACRREIFKAAALAHEQQKTEFVFQLFELLRQSRLGRMDMLGRRGDVETGVGDRDEIAQLDQGHCSRSD